MHDRKPGFASWIEPPWRDLAQLAGGSAFSVHAIDLEKDVDGRPLRSCRLPEVWSAKALRKYRGNHTLAAGTQSFYRRSAKMHGMLQILKAFESRIVGEAKCEFHADPWNRSEKGFRRQFALQPFQL
jgi:hypothetical protein